MELIYQGVDIAPSVDIAGCIHHETSGENCDLLDITLENADRWYSWHPRIDDTINVKLQGYQTGTLYLNTIYPQNGQFRILATSVPRAARMASFASYENIQLDALMAACAAECGMKSALYGMDSELTYAYLMRGMESPAAFMKRICEWEGAVFKTAGGRFAGIGIEHIQAQRAAQSIALSGTETGFSHIRRDDLKLSALTLKTPYFECTAYDESASDGNYKVMTNIPATDEIQAGRWARGILLAHNRKAERVIIDMEFNPGLSALARVDLYGNADTNGEWVADEVEHDLIARETTVTLLRSITTIR